MQIVIALILVLWLPNVAAATAILEGKIAGLSFGDSSQNGRAKLRTFCEDIREVAVEPPSFPLAKNEELHLICSKFSIGAKSVGSLALTFADDQLVMLYAEGNAVEFFRDFTDGKLQQYLHYSVLFREFLIVDRNADQVWVMSEDAAHPNLFQWPNPYVTRSTRVDYTSSAKVPEVLEFSKTLEELQPTFEEHCAFTQLSIYDVWLLSQPDLQQQLDCFGLEFAGFPRKVEAVFGDGILEQAWILTGKGEEDRVRKALVAEYGDPVFVNDKWEVFHENQVMLRKDKPEVLMLSTKLAPLFREKEIDGK